MLVAVILAFVLGCMFSLLLATTAWLYTAAVVRKGEVQDVAHFKAPDLPEGSFSEKKESCRWLNLVTAFLFQELRDTQAVKSFVLAKVHREFNELMFLRKEGRMLEQLTVRDYDLGTSLPVFSNAVVLQQQLCSDSGELKELCVGVTVDYSGGFSIGVDADLIFNRVAYVAIRIVKVKGHGQLQFCALPAPHWSFSFTEDPELVLEVKSTFEGRSFPQLSSFMEAQLRRWVRQKHTLPVRKTRYKPFFSKPLPQTQLTEMYVHEQRLTVGQLSVEILRGSQLAHPPSAVGTFCSVSLSCLPWQPLLEMWHSKWVEHEFRVQVTDPLATLGIGYRQVEWVRKGRKIELVMISKVMEGSVAASAGIQTGDVIVRVNNARTHSMGQVRRTIEKNKYSSVLLAVKRPPKHISQHMLQSGSTHLAVQKKASDVSSDVEREETQVREEVDSISLQGVEGERALPTGSGQRSAASSADARRTVFQRCTGDREETEEIRRETEEVEVCTAPQWTRNKFRFSIGPLHHYLNICVYDRLCGEERGELLIGHATIPLMDVSLECLASSSGRHRQRYVLLAPELARASSSRAAVQASEERRGSRGRGRQSERVARLQEEGNKYVGALLLQFRHSSKWNSATAQDEEEACDSPQELEVGSHILHEFHTKEKTGPQKCHVCYKRIWALKGRVLVCKKCDVQCHKKCQLLSHTHFPCKPANTVDLELHESGGFQIYGDMEEGREGESWEHRGLKQQTLDAGGESELLCEGNTEQHREEEESERSSDELFTSAESWSGGEDETEQTLAELLACRMFSHLPEPERPTAIHNKVLELESEIERAEQLVADIQAELNGGQGNEESLRNQLRQHREKLEPLLLMKRQYTLALDQMMK